MLVKDQIIDALDKALKELQTNPPAEVYSDCNFDWDINIVFKDGSVDGYDDFCVECYDASPTLETAIGVGGQPDPESWPDVFEIIKSNFDYFFDEMKDREILTQPAELLDLDKTNFFVKIYEVVDDGADVFKYFLQPYYFSDLIK